MNVQEKIHHQIAELRQERDRHICDMRATGSSMREISTQCGLSLGMVHRVLANGGLAGHNEALSYRRAG